VCNCIIHNIIDINTPTEDDASQKCTFDCIRCLLITPAVLGRPMEAGLGQSGLGHSHSSLPTLNLPNLLFFFSTDFTTYTHNF
jgi:hypothetical protein